MFKNKFLKDVLTIEDEEKESIYSIIGRMESLLCFFKESKEYKGFAPFLEVYLNVTKTVYYRALENEKFYDNFKKLEKVDIHFANLYFKPLRKFLFEDNIETPWVTYINYCKQNQGTPFVQLLLGINAHINSDLLSTIVDLKYDEADDYFKVNDILLSIIPSMMLDLAREYKDVMGLGGLIFQPIVHYEFEKTIVKWRADVWTNAFVVKEGNSKEYKHYYHQKTEKIGEEVIQIFSNIMHLQQIKGSVKELNSLKVEV